MRLRIQQRDEDHMTPPETGSNSYGAPPRQRLPGWIWGLGACACLPIIAIFALGLVATPFLRRLKDAQREAGRTSICLTNIKQMAQGMQMYAQDYDDRFPVASSWMDGAASYAENGGTKDKAIFQCPTVKVVQPNDFGYAFNSKLAGKPQSKITAQAVTQLVYDSSKLGRNASDAVTSLPSPARHRTRGMRRNPGRVNIMGYADGHAKAVSEKGRTIAAPGLDTSQ
jgi:hypothetical protein